jgi:hypothetical protein
MYNALLEIGQPSAQLSSPIWGTQRRDLWWPFRIQQRSIEGIQGEEYHLNSDFGLRISE